jgi:GNAT superfamily N-acetyltransferase
MTNRTRGADAAIDHGGSGLSAIRIRWAVAQDARAIAEIGVRGWQAAYRGILPDGFLDGLSVDAREIAWRMTLESDETGDAPAWLAERHGRSIGFVASGPPRDDDVPLPAAEVYAIYVMPDSWRSGAGKALLTTAVDHWKDRGAGTLALWVLEANARGRAFYDAMGWRADGRRQQIDLGGFTATEVRYRVRL